MAEGLEPTVKWQKLLEMPSDDTREDNSKGGKANGSNFGVLTSLAHYRPAPTHPRGIEPPNGGRTDVYLR